MRPDTGNPQTAVSVFFFFFIIFSRASSLTPCPQAKSDQSSAQKGQGCLLSGLKARDDDLSPNEDQRAPGCVLHQMCHTQINSELCSLS